MEELLLYYSTLRTLTKKSICQSYYKFDVIALATFRQEQEHSSSEIRLLHNKKSYELTSQNDVKPLTPLS